MLVETTRGNKVLVSETIEFTLEECITCFTPFMMPTRLQKQLRENHKVFYCPHGHNMYYSGPSEIEKLKKELEAQKQKSVQREEELTNRLLDTMNEKKIQKQLKRVHKGVCPCCNRSFVNLQKHMKSKHPEQVVK